MKTEFSLLALDSLTLAERGKQLSARHTSVSVCVSGGGTFERE